MAVELYARAANCYIANELAGPLDFYMQRAAEQFPSSLFCWAVTRDGPSFCARLDPSDIRLALSTLERLESTMRDSGLLAAPLSVTRRDLPGDLLPLADLASFAGPLLVAAELRCPDGGLRCDPAFSIYYGNSRDAFSHRKFRLDDVVRFTCHRQSGSKSGGARQPGPS